MTFFRSYASDLRASFESGLLKELTPYPHFVVWRYRLIDGKYKKPLYNPKTHFPAMVDTPNTWGTVDQALQALATGRYNGVGFVLSEEDPFTGIDLDNCVGNNGAIDQWAKEIITAMQTYTEYFPGKGIHLFAQGTLSAPGRKIGNVEMYSDRHYMTITTRHIDNTSTPIEPRQEALAQLYKQFVPDHPQTLGNTRGSSGCATVDASS